VNVPIISHSPRSAWPTPCRHYQLQFLLCNANCRNKTIPAIMQKVPFVITEGINSSYLEMLLTGRHGPRRADITNYNFSNTTPTAAIKQSPQLCKKNPLRKTEGINSSYLETLLTGRHGPRRADITNCNFSNAIPTAAIKQSPQLCKKNPLRKNGGDKDSYYFVAGFFSISTTLLRL